MRPVALPDDLDQLEGLFAACVLADGHAPIGEHKYLSLLGDVEGSSLAFVDEVERTVVSYLHLAENADEGGWTFEAAVHPSHRTEQRLIALAEVALAETRARGGTSLRTWIYNATWPESLAALGFRPERELRQLRVRLPLDAPVYPTGIRRKTFRPGQDDEAWLAVNNAAFSGHPENGSWTRRILADRQDQPWWDPEGVVMAWEDGNLVGFCWTKDHGDGIGEIYVIAVHPDHRRHGMGRSLTLDGLDVLAGKGCVSGMLYVDAANAIASRLYESLGFTLHHIDQSMIAAVEG